MDKKKLIMVTGPAGIGKTTVYKELYKKINGGADIAARLSIIFMI